MKVALGQMQICWENKRANLEKAERYLELSAERGTELFLLPEMSLTGFSMHTEKTKESEQETIVQIQGLAEKYHTAIGVGWVKDTGALCENHYSVVTPEGGILDYAKLHPFRFAEETEYFRGGSSLPVLEYKGFWTGVQICYDLRFPEPFQILSKRADLIVVPANWPSVRSEHWKCLLKARAIENMVYVAGVNCAGKMGGAFYSGDSGVYAPDGTSLGTELIRLPGACREEQVQLCEIENDVSRRRERFPVKEDRREDLYRKLQKETQELWTERMNG